MKILETLAEFFARKLLQDGKQLKSRLAPKSKLIAVDGVFFRIRRLNVLDHAAGAKVLQEMYSLYKTKDELQAAAKQAETVASLERAKGHFRDILVSGVVEPKLKRKDTDDGVLLVDDIFDDWFFAQKLVTAILEYTYGKKKR